MLSSQLVYLALGSCCPPKLEPAGAAGAAPATLGSRGTGGSLGCPPWPVGRFSEERNDVVLEMLQDELSFSLKYSFKRELNAFPIAGARVPQEGTKQRRSDVSACGLLVLDAHRRRESCRLPWDAQVNGRSVAVRQNPSVFRCRL